MLNGKFNEVMQNLEKNIESKKDLRYVKGQVTELTMTYLGELGKLENIYNKNIEKVCTKLLKLENKTNKIEEKISKVKEETKNDEEIDVEPIKCPYCNMNFLIEYDSNNTEVRCPECKNIIELNWDTDAEEDDM